MRFSAPAHRLCVLHLRLLRDAFPNAVQMFGMPPCWPARQDGEAWTRSRTRCARASAERAGPTRPQAEARAADWRVFGSPARPLRFRGCSRCFAARRSVDFAVDGPAGRMRVGVSPPRRRWRRPPPHPQRRSEPARPAAAEDVTDARSICQRPRPGLWPGRRWQVDDAGRPRRAPQPHPVSPRHHARESIEYRYAPQRCFIHQREIGVHTPTFADRLRAALREPRSPSSWASCATARPSPSP